MDERTMITSGNPELDGRMGGGLPVGSLTLIEGSSGSGKSVLAQQLIWGALQDGFSVSLFTSENTVKTLIRQMDSIDLDVLDFLLIDRFRAYPIEPARLGENALDTLFNAVQHETSRDIIIIDSFTAALSHLSDRSRMIGFFEESKRLSAKDITLIITLHAEAISRDLIDLIRSKCDAHFRLQAEQDGQRLVKTLQVTKVRGASGATGSIVGFDVEPGWGLRIIPISKARG